MKTASTLSLLSLAAVSSLGLLACGGGAGAWGGATGTPSITSSGSPSATPSISPTPLPPISISSATFTNGGSIPLSAACAAQGGSNQSFQITWDTPLPVGTGKLAIIMDDESAPCGTGDNACVHWGVFNIPLSVSQLAAGVNPMNVSPNIKLGQNYDGSSQYAGVCPAADSGTHTYKVSVYALSGSAPNEPGGNSITRSEFRSTYGAYLLGEGVLSGTYTAPPP